MVHNEGELVLYNILRTHLDKGDLTSIKGTENQGKKNPTEERITDLDIIPSPYSSGLLLQLIDNHQDYKLIASWESNRGCPYQCVFCDWGSATKTKLRNFSEEKLFEEIEWFGKNKIIYIDVCDGNFGIFSERDYRIAEKLTSVKKDTGCPEKINLTWVKASSEKILPIAKKLAEGDLLRAISLSVQSLDANTLKIIKRSNVKFDNFKNLVALFDSENLQSYTELIMGLPGETIATYKNNWEILASIYPSPSILTWNCSVFNNAPMNDEAYKKQYGIEVFKSPMFMQHSGRQDEDKIKEYERMVRRTFSLPGDDIIEVYVYNWTMLVFHAFGILEFIARYFNEIGISYTAFYENLTKHMKSSNGLFAQEYNKAVLHAKNGYDGHGWNSYDPELGEINWPMEEASWLRLVGDKQALSAEIKSFTEKFLPLDDFAKDLHNFQMLLINSPNDADPLTEKLSFNWVEFFLNKQPLTAQASIYGKSRKIKNVDIVQWGAESIWYGRRAQKYKTKLGEICVKEDS